MDTLCHAALVCCILSALAGLVRTFWPQNGFKPVINAVLTLYIITSVLHAVSGLNWQNFDAQLQNFASQSAPGEDYTAYGAEPVSYTHLTYNHIGPLENFEKAIAKAAFLSLIHIFFPPENRQAQSG